jgi:phage shock protein PspC (stress-responsive transcriptional regulator)
MKRLYRSKTEKKFGGICGGLGEYLDLDPTIIRLVILVLIFVSGIIPGIIGYLIAMWIIPEKPQE